MKISTAHTAETIAFLERLRTVKRLYELTIPRIAEEANMPVGTVTHQLAGYNNLDIRVLLAVSRLCPDVSADWLLSGVGDISRASAHDIVRRLDSIEQKVSKIAK